MTGIVSDLDNLQRGFISPRKFMGRFLYGAISSFQPNSYLMHKRKDLDSDYLISSMDVASNRLAVAYTEDAVSIHDMDPSEKKLNTERGRNRLIIEWKRPNRPHPYRESRKTGYSCVRLRKYDGGIMTLSGESGNLGILDASNMQYVCDIEPEPSCSIYEHTFSPGEEVLVADNEGGAVRKSQDKN